MESPIRESRTQTLCSFCSTPLIAEDYNNPNNFYLVCHQHKLLGELETRKFFKENPDYRTWQRDISNKNK